MKTLTKVSIFRGVFVAMFFAAVGLIVSPVAQAQAAAPVVQEQGPADLIIKVSGQTGTYYKMGQQIQQVCAKPSIKLSESAGTLQAYDDVLANRANLMFLTTDVLWGRKTVERDPQVDSLRVLMPLYNAELHMVARRTDPNVNKFSDLGNKKIGTYGSGNITARIAMGTGGLRPASLQDYTSEKGALDALAKNEVDAVFIVVGQPAGWASGLNGQVYKLLELDQTGIIGKNGYQEAALRYPNLSTASVKTLSTKVSLVAYNYEGKKMIGNLSDLKACITENIGDLKDTTGNHPKWREVNPKAVSDWPMFPTATAAPAKKK